MLPPIYQDATVRCVIPLCPVRECLGLGIQQADGSVLRFALDAAGVELLRLSLADYCQSPAGTQSPMSPLMSSDPKSVPSVGVNV